MSLPPLGALVDLIIRLRLAPPEALRSVQALIASQSSEEFVDLLEKQQVLTGFQIERLRTGDTDGLVLGDCKLMYRVASGSFARFYRGANVVTGQQLGIKVLRDRWANDPDFVSLFRREGEIGKRLIHPNIVPIYEVGSSGKYHFLVMEFVEGGNLRDFLKIRKKFSIIETLKFAVDVLKGLDFALRQGITHRDLKMTNVLMSSSGVAKLIDFGLAADDSMISKANGSALQNALEYSTLEKHTGAPRNDPRSDLYFLGGILFELRLQPLSQCVHLTQRERCPVFSPLPLPLCSRSSIRAMPSTGSFTSVRTPSTVRSANSAWCGASRSSRSASASSTLAPLSRSP